MLAEKSPLCPLSPKALKNLPVAGGQLHEEVPAEREPIRPPWQLRELSWAGLGWVQERRGAGWGKQGPGPALPMSCHGNHDLLSASQKR